MNRTKAVSIAAAALLAIGLSAGAARAQYGGLAYDPDSRLWGRSTNMANPRDASATALRFCRSRGCRSVVNTGPGQCGAIAAVRRSSAYHWATRPSRREAEHDAISGCEAANAQRCDLIVVQCNE